MRLKQLLLCTLLFVLVRSNKYTSDYTCTHDGYSAPDGSCECTDYYGKKDCSQTQCVNTGALSPYERDVDFDQRCSCPPGFLGLHCEPVQCVDGDVKSFDLVDHARDVSIIITYNEEFQEQFTSKDKGGPIQNTICDAVFNQPDVGQGSNFHFWLMEIDITVATIQECKKLFNYAVQNSCEETENKDGPEYSCEGTLTTKYISSALEQMGEDSRLIIISNLGIDDFENEEGIEAIRKKAISMRIQMHSLVISPRKPMDNIVYFQDGYQVLRELSESTMGFFINPFDGSGGQKLGDDGITTILNQMMEVFFRYVVVDRLVTTNSSCTDPTDYTTFRALEKTGDNTFWLTVIGNSAPMKVYKTEWLGGNGVAPTKKIDAGYFNAYTLKLNYGDVITFKPYSTYGNGKVKCVPSNVLILSKSGHLARFAITNSLDLDATSPFAISGDTEKNILVGHFTRHYHEENLEKLHLDFSSENTPFDLNLDLVPTPRNCQYNAKFGEVSCKDGDDTFIRVRDLDSGAAVTVQNLYCSPKDSDAVSNALSLNTISRLAAGDPPPPACTESPIKVKKDGRALIISAHATETIFSLFNGNKNSAIKYLNDLDDLQIYDQYIINIYNADQATDAIVVNTYYDFKEKMMTKWHTYTRNESAVPSGDWVYRDQEEVVVDEADLVDGAFSTTEEYTTPEPEDPIFFDEECTADVSAVYPLEDLTNRFTNALPNSDMIFIFDRKINISKEDEMNVLKDAYSKRLKLIVLLLGCETADFSDSNALTKWNSIASETGGFAVHFSLPSDLNKFLASYVDWVSGQAAATIDTGFTMDPIKSTPFAVKKGGSYTIILNTVPAATEATLSNGKTLTNPKYLGNSVALFDYQADDDIAAVTVTAKPPLYYFYYASIRVLDLNDDYATIGFTKSLKESCVEEAYPDYNPHEAQYPITSASADDSVSMTLFNSAGVPFRTGPASGTNGNFVLNYNWRCNDNQNIYYISADVNTPEGSFTRLFTTECIGESDGAACVNGEQDKTNKNKCICTHDYTGDLCDIPVCQNGGEVTPSFECKCQPDYSGFFCESYDACKLEADFMPAFKTIATTVIFVVEKSDAVVKNMGAIAKTTFDNVRAAQYVIVEYGNSSDVNVIVSTTDKASLVTYLKGIESVPFEADDVSSTITPDMYYDAIPAITAALKTQVTDSAQLFWFAETDNAENFDDSVLDVISHQRVSITALFADTVIPSGSIHPVQLSGGSVFYAPTATPYAPFFTNYIAELLQFQPNFEFRPNLLSSSLKCDAKLEVNIDQSTYKLFVAAANADSITISTDVSKLVDTTTAGTAIPGGTVFTFTKDTKNKKLYNGAGTVTITIKSKAGETYCPSTVTAFSQTQIDYGFSKDETDTKASITSHKGEHLLVTYWTSESPKDTPTPTAVITPITLDEGFGNSTEIYMTVRNNCSYSLSVPIDCSDDVSAYGVTISNWVIQNDGVGNTYKVDRYIPVLCPAGTCQHGNLTDAGDCACDPFYGGDYCTDFLCNNGILVDDICACYTGYGGDYCEEKVDPKDRAGVAYLLIQDVCGDDDKLKDSAQGVLSDYMALFKTFDNFYLGTNSPDQSDVVLVKSVGELTTAMASNRAATANCANPSLGGIIDSFYQALRQPALVSSFMFAAASGPVVGNARVAHVTTVGVDSSTGKDLKNLSIDFILTMEFVGITDKNEYFPAPDAFNAFPGDFTETYDPEVALLDLVNTFGSEIKPSIPSPDSITSRCIMNLQAAIGFHTDISSVPGASDYRAKAQKIFQSVTKYFTVPKGTIDIDDETCDFDKSQEKDKSLFYGSIYANSSSIINPTFCMSNMDSYPKNVGDANYKQADQVTLQSVIDSYTKWYNADTKMICHCFDYKNPDTTKIIMWAPLSPTSLDKGAVNFDGFKLANFQHIVLPFGFDYGNSPVWRSLVPDKDMWLTDASKANYDVDEIIQDIWTIICRLSGKIEVGQTAEPFNPYTTKKPKTGDNKQDPDTTDDTLVGDDLPR